MLRLVLLLSFGAWAGTAAEPPKFRVPDTASPVHYSVELTVRPGEDTFHGVADIDIAVSQTTPVLWLSARQLTVESAILHTGGVRRPTRTVPGGENFIGFAFDGPLAPGQATLHVAYSGKVHRDSTKGVFQLRDGPNPPWYVYTNFEAADARRAFPCFDEPRFKTPWQLTLHVQQEHLAASNTPIVSETPEAGGMKRVEFAPTRPLPSYLVAFAVGPFDVVDAGKGGRKQAPLRILVPAGRANEAGFARTAIPRLLKLLEYYFDSSYPYEKLDSVAMPTSGFAMENVGLITYSQAMILSKPALASSTWRRDCALTAAHEMAHHWFGDLVTNRWWDAWLNESFATWMQYKIVGQWKPEWEIPVKVVQSNFDTMAIDNLATPRRVRRAFENDGDVASGFDAAAVYGKGSAVIGMFERYIGERAFQNGIRQYLKQFANQTATTGDFLAVMCKTTGQDVARAFGTFLDQPGVPLVTAEIDCANGTPRLALSQRQSLPVGARDETSRKWTIPICVKYPADGGRGATGHECAMVSDASFEMKLAMSAGAAGCPAWVLANDGETGYYRVHYRDAMLGKLLADGGRRLTVAERVGVLADVGALAPAGEMPVDEALTWAKTFSRDSDWRVVSQTLGIAGLLRDPAVPDELLPNAARFLRRVYGERALELGWNSRPEDSDGDKNLRRRQVNLVASAGEDEELVREAQALTLRWLGDPGSVDPDMAGQVVAVAAAHGDQALFDRMRAALHQAKDDGQFAVLVEGISGFRDPAIVKQRLAILLTDEFKIDDVLSFVESTRETRRLPFEFVQHHLDALLKKLPREGPDYGAYLPTLGDDFCSAPERAGLDAFFKPRMGQYPGWPEALAQTLEKIDLCIARRQALGPGLEKFLKKY